MRSDDRLVQAMQLENCASWNMDRAEICERESREHPNVFVRSMMARDAERHDMQAFRLFRQAHELRSGLRW